MQSYLYTSNMHKGDDIVYYHTSVVVCACALTSNMQTTVSKNENPKFDRESLRTKDLLAPQAYLIN